MPRDLITIQCLYPKTYVLTIATGLHGRNITTGGSIHHGCCTLSRLPRKGNGTVFCGTSGAFSLGLSPLLHLLWPLPPMFDLARTVLPSNTKASLGRLYPFWLGFSLHLGRLIPTSNLSSVRTKQHLKLCWNESWPLVDPLRGQSKQPHWTMLVNYSIST